ncbi:MAG: hypothetical protein ACI9O4_000841 [Chitinophagales bacterium]|jgi:hypothetical protein
MCSFQQPARKKEKPNNFINPCVAFYVYLKVMTSYQFQLLSLALVLSFAYDNVQAQLFPNQDIQVFENGSELPNAWLGGLDLPQFSDGDINQDGRKDLLIFDRKANKTLVLLKEANGEYRYAPDLEKYFPEMMRFALFKDYNCDGLTDIFAFVNTGIQVYEQEIIGGNISFKQVSSLLKFDLGGFQVNIYNSNGDIPGIEDVDGDGDLDILVFYNLGTTLPFYRNLSVEMGYGCDSLIFEEYTSCWGLFSEGNTNNNVNFDIACKGGTGTPVASGGPKHIGSTILLFDPNKDNRMDILLGDVSFNTMVYLQNDATSIDAHMASALADYSYPSYDVSADVEIFPAAFYVDVTNDGEKDLLVAPNSTTAHVNTTSSWLYENTGDTTEPFQFVKNNFLIDETIDLGSYSYPTFFDQNGDGLEDLIIANGFLYENMGTTIGSLSYYENTGSDTLPEFTLMDDDYLGLASFGADFLRPSFGDLDNDGDKDLILGDANGLIHYYENTAGSGVPASFTQTQLEYFNIDVGNKAHPQLIDLNGDSLLDLLIGREGSYGELAYFWNFGTAAVAEFHADSSNQALGEIRTNQPGFIPGFSAPFILETDSNTILYVGNDVGFIQSYLVNKDSLKQGSFEMLSPGLLPSRAGIRTNLSIIDIDNNNDMDFFVGNARGGVNYFSGEKSADTTIIDTTGIAIRDQYNHDFGFELYPNPSEGDVIIRFEESQSIVEIEIINPLGQRLLKQKARNTSIVKLDSRDLSKGIYYIKVRNKEDLIQVKSFLKN